MADEWRIDFDRGFPGLRSLRLGDSVDIGYSQVSMGSGARTEHGVTSSSANEKRRGAIHEKSDAHEGMDSIPCSVVWLVNCC